MFRRLIAAGRWLRRLLPPDRPEDLPPAYEDPHRAIILYLIVAWIALLLIFAFARYVRAEERAAMIERVKAKGKRGKAKGKRGKQLELELE